MVKIVFAVALILIGMVIGCLISWEHFSAKDMGNLIVTSDEDGVYTALEINQKEFSDLKDKTAVQFRVVRKNSRK